MYLDSSYSASGQLFWDDGDSVGVYEDDGGRFNHLEFLCRPVQSAKVGKSHQQHQLTSTVKHYTYREEPMKLDYVAIFGVESNPSTVAINGETVNHYFDKDIKVRATSQLNS